MNEELTKKGSLTITKADIAVIEFFYDALLAESYNNINKPIMIMARDLINRSYNAFHKQDKEAKQNES